MSFVPFRNTVKYRTSRQRKLVARKCRIRSRSHFNSLTIERLEPRQLLATANPIGDQFLVNEAFSHRGVTTHGCRFEC